MTVYFHGLWGYGPATGYEGAAPDVRSVSSDDPLPVTVISGSSSTAVAQNSTTSGQTGGLVQGATTTAAPSYTTGKTNPLSLTTAGALRTDGSAVTQPVSGTVGITGSTTGAAIPSTASVAGYSDGTNVQIPRLFDSDSGAGTEYVTGVSLRLAASGGSVEVKNGQGDGANATGALNILPMMYNGSTHDRFRSAVNALNSTGTGILAIANTAQFDDTSPTAITENQFGNMRMSANRNLYNTIRDAAGNERGVNVTSGNALTVDPSAAPATTLPNNVSATGSVSATPKNYRGFSFRETTGTTSATITLYDNTAGSGTILETIQLAPGESSREHYGNSGIVAAVGIWAVITGTVVGSVRTS